MKVVARILLDQILDLPEARPAIVNLDKSAPQADEKVLSLPNARQEATENAFLAIGGVANILSSKPLQLTPYLRGLWASGICYEKGVVMCDCKPRRRKGSFFGRSDF
jgi:hypothetical protein